MFNINKAGQSKCLGENFIRIITIIIILAGASAPGRVLCKQATLTAE